MLKEFESFVSYHLQAANHSLNALWRKPLASFMTMLVIAITLTLPALFWAVSDDLQHLGKKWKNGGNISLYLKTSLSSAEENALLTQIRALEGVGKASLKTAAEGLAELKQQEGMEDVMRYLPTNPLPAVVEVIPSLAWTQPFQVQQLFTKLQAFPQVEQAKLDMEWIMRLQAIMKVLRKVAHAVIFLLGLALVLIIGNTLRLAIQDSHNEIQVLKLIGATDSFISRPFLYTGVWYGLGGAIFSVLFINIFLVSFAAAMRQLATMYQMHYPITTLSVKQAYTVVLVAMGLGWLGAKLSIRQQLASIELQN